MEMILAVSSYDRKMLETFLTNVVGNYRTIVLWDGDDDEDLSDLGVEVLRFKEISKVVFKELDLTDEEIDHVLNKTNTFHKCIGYDYLMNVMKLDGFFFSDDDVFLRKELSFESTTLFKDSLLKKMVVNRGQELEPKMTLDMIKRGFVPIFVGNFFLKVTEESRKEYRRLLRHTISCIPPYFEKHVKKIKNQDNLATSRQGKVFFLDSLFLQFFFNGHVMAKEDFVIGKDIYIASYAKNRHDLAAKKSIVHFNVSDKEAWVKNFLEHIENRREET
jgi:hypothetical protein